MTPKLATPGIVSDSPIFLHDLVKKHGNQSKAAVSWGVSQSAVSRLLNGKRGRKDSDVLRAIARAEGIVEEQIRVWPHLRALDHAPAGVDRFVYDVDDPHHMLKQVQHWFADLPAETRMQRQVVKAVMRALFDESFGAVHGPSREWRVVMQRVDGLEHVELAPKHVATRGRLSV